MLTLNISECFYSLNSEMDSSAKTKEDVSLLSEVIHLLVYGFTLRVKFEPVIVEQVQVSLQAGDVFFVERLDFRWISSIPLQQTPLGFQQFVLLLQKSDLEQKQQEPILTSAGTTDPWTLNICIKGFVLDHLND